MFCILRLRPSRIRGVAGGIFSELLFLDCTCPVPLSERFLLPLAEACRFPGCDDHCFWLRPALDRRSSRDRRSPFLLAGFLHPDAGSACRVWKEILRNFSASRIRRPSSS